MENSREVKPEKSLNSKYLLVALAIILFYDGYISFKQFRYNPKQVDVIPTAYAAESEIARPITPVTEYTQDQVPALRVTGQVNGVATTVEFVVQKKDPLNSLRTPDLSK